MRQRRATRATRRRRRGGPPRSASSGAPPIPRSSSSCSPAPAATPASSTGSSATWRARGLDRAGSAPRRARDRRRPRSQTWSPPSRPSSARAPGRAHRALRSVPRSTTSCSSRSATFLSTPRRAICARAARGGPARPRPRRAAPDRRRCGRDRASMPPRVATCTGGSRACWPSEALRRPRSPSTSSPPTRGHRRRATCSWPRVRLRSRRHRASPRTSSTEPSHAGVDAALARAVRAPRRLRSPATRTLPIALADGAIGGSAESTARADARARGCARSPWSLGAGTSGRTARSRSTRDCPDGAVRALGAVAEAALGRREPDDAPHGRRRGPARGDRGRRRPVPRTSGAVAARAGTPCGAPAAGEAADLLESAGATGRAARRRRTRSARSSRSPTGDSDDAERMAGRGADAEIGGPAALRRHRLLGGFAALRAGRWDRAQQAVDAAAGPVHDARRVSSRGALAVGARAPRR